MSDQQLTVSLLSGVSSRRLPAWVAVMAILMLFIAPLVSQTLARTQTSAETPHSAMMMMSGDHEMSMPAHHGMMPMTHSADSNMAVMDPVACGYCVLLLHLPILNLITHPLLFWLALRVLPRPARRSPTFFINVRVFNDARPRAPPLH